MPPATPTISIAHAKMISIVPFLLIIAPQKLSFATASDARAAFDQCDR